MYKNNNVYNNITDKALLFKSFYLLGNSLNYCYDCKYCRLNGEKVEEKHECILKKKGICEFPTEDCSNINGNIIKINDTITTSDVRIIKWLTGYTVDANFYESPHISKEWVKNKK